MTVNEKINITLQEGQKEVIVRQGAALPPFKVRDGIEVFGTISVPKEHLTKPSGTDFNVEFLKLGDYLEESFLLVKRDDKKLVFIENAGKEYESKYEGTLALDSNFKALGINDADVSYTPLQLAEKLKLYRSFFETKTEAMKLVSILRDFEAKVNQEVEAKADERANRKVLLQQTVTTNIPEGFKLKIPVFKGFPSEVLEVEIGIDPMNLNCRLLSPEANDFVFEKTNEVIDAELAAINQFLNGFGLSLRIFEQ